MRRATLAGLLAVVLAPAVRADSTPYKAVVADAEVTLRAGPSDQFPDTGTLPRGTPVVVERDEGNGWLAVAAPKGSVSWIAFAFVEDPAADRPAPRRGFVSHEGEVTLAAGKADLAQPLNIRKEKVPQGTAVLIIGPTVTFDGKKWLPIEPPHGDVRYLPKTAVKFDAPLKEHVAVRVNESVTPLPSAAPLGALASIPGSVTPASGGATTTAGKTAINHPLWTQAEAAERDNRFEDAKKHLFKLADELNAAGTDHDVVNLCYSRLHAVCTKQREAQGGSKSTALPVTSAANPPSVLRPPAREERGVRPGTPEPLPSAAPTGGAADDRTPLSGTGVLRRSALTPAGLERQVYALESAPGAPTMYVSAGPGVDLDRYVGRRVDVSGYTVKSKLSKPYMVATSVELGQ